MKRVLITIEDWIKQKWNALMERLRRSRSEARICARLDKLEGRVCDRLRELEVYIDGRLAQPEVPAPAPDGTVDLEMGIYNRLSSLEASICNKLAEFEVHLHGRLAEPEEPAPIFVPEAPVPLGSISVPIGDGQRTVEFQGAELSQRFYAEGLKRITETLYGTNRGRYLVHIRTLYRGKGLRTEFNLREIDEDDLKEGGKYAVLWQLHQPVSLEEALETQ
jgi:hypothetical protein